MPIARPVVRGAADGVDPEQLVDLVERGVELVAAVTLDREAELDAGSPRARFETAMPTTVTPRSRSIGIAV